MNRNRGFTLIELIIVIVVAAIGITLAVPSFIALIERKSVGGAAEATYELLQRARSQAVKRSKPIVVDFHVSGTNWAVGLTDKIAGCAAEDASGGGACTIEYDNDEGVDYNSDGLSDKVLMRIQGSNHRNITMSTATAFADVLTSGCTEPTAAPAGAACFDNVRGLARTGQINFASANNYTLQVQVDQLGHVKICYLSDKNIVGYAKCPS